MRTRTAFGLWSMAPLPEKAAPDVIAKAIAAALRVKEQAGQDTLATLREELAAKSLLLVLDTCEHVEQANMRVVHACCSPVPVCAFSPPVVTTCPCRGKPSVPLLRSLFLQKTPS